MAHPTGKEPVRILHVEDDPQDAELVSIMLEVEGLPCELRRVDTRQAFEDALSREDWHLIISDYLLPAYDGLKALATARKSVPGVPFILFSGTIGEEMAIESLKNGATDYVLKQRPGRLVPAVRHALEEAREQAKQRRMEQELLRSEQQRQQLEAQFLRAQRMESLGALVSGMAHDLNNALAPIVMGVGLLQTEPLSREAKQVLANMETGAKRGADMVRQVLAFARGTEGKSAVVRVELLVAELDRIIRNLFPKSIEWRARTQSGLWSLSGFPTQLHQVLMNLCINARDAMPQGGRLTLSAENLWLDEQTSRIYPDAVPGPYLKFVVSDTGTGMTPDVQEKVFQPFYTTKGPEKGTGLGLSTSLNIVKSHDGFILVKSHAGQGTEFSVYLPALTDAGAAQVEDKPKDLPLGHGEMILVVDDEAAICEITKATLENYGYKVMAATNGAEAVALFADNRSRIHLVLTDASMPYMDGRAVSLALRRINPKLKIIAASGDARKEDTSCSTRVDALIDKPYTAEKLLVTVYRVLTGKD